MKDNCNLEWEEIFANEDTDKKFISKTYKEPQIVQYQKHNNPRHKWAKHRNGYFLEEDIGIVIRHMRTCSASLILTQRQIKSSVRDHLTVVQTAISKHLQKDMSPALAWRRQWHPTPALLPGKSHGWTSLVGCSPWGQ